jgi:hypothetical protein
MLNNISQFIGNFYYKGAHHHAAVGKSTVRLQNLYRSGLNLVPDRHPGQGYTAPLKRPLQDGRPSSFGTSIFVGVPKPIFLAY